VVESNPYAHHQEKKGETDTERGGSQCIFNLRSYESSVWKEAAFQLSSKKKEKKKGAVKSRGPAVRDSCSGKRGTVKSVVGEKRLAFSPGKKRTRRGWAVSAWEGHVQRLLRSFEKGRQSPTVFTLGRGKAPIPKAVGSSSVQLYREKKKPEPLAAKGETGGD